MAINNDLNNSNFYQESSNSDEDIFEVARVISDMESNDEDENDSFEIE